MITAFIQIAIHLVIVTILFLNGFTKYDKTLTNRKKAQGTHPPSPYLILS